MHGESVDDVRMNVDLLVVANCLNEQVALSMIEMALTDLGTTATVRTIVIDSEDKARMHGFIGSPTIRVNGKDCVASADSPTGVACRVYRTPNGLSGVPTMKDVRRAVAEAGS